MTRGMTPIGIDLGTSRSAIAYFDGEASKIIPNIFGETTTPSRVILTPDGQYRVGRDAENYSEKYESLHFTVGSIKRQMHECQGFVIRGKRYYPQIISAMILAQLRKQAENFLKNEVEEAVICIPCNFGVIQRFATIEAAEMAGLKVLRIVNEATAAAVAFNYLSGGNREDRELIFDLGAGTLDLSLIDYWGNGAIHVEAIEGEEFLGGDDFDERIIRYIVDETKKEQGFDPIEDQNFESHHIAKLRLKEAAEKAKVDLSSQDRAKIYIPYIRNILGKPQHIDMEITISVFEAICADLLDKTLEQIDKLAVKANSRKKVEKEIIKITERKSLVDRILFRKPQKREKVEKVTQEILTPAKFVFTGGGSKMRFITDAIKQRYKSAFTFIDRDKELVALGAAICAAIIKGDCKNWLLMDCASKSIGIGLQDDKYQIIFPKNDSIPTRKKDTFTTTVENQTYINIPVYEGENKKASLNRKLLDLKFGTLANAKAGELKIEVNFEIDVNNTLHVEAIDTKTNSKLQSVNSMLPYTSIDSKLKNQIKQLLVNV